SFDPIHLGHLRAAEEAREALSLDQVRFVPAANPPHKPGRKLADGADRLEMIRLAIADQPAFAVSTVELDRGGVSYSVDTLAQLRHPPASLFFLVGVDAFREIHLWRDAPRLFELANVVVVRRPPAPIDDSIDHLPIAAREAFCYDPGTRSHRHRSGTSLSFLPITGLDVSATSIRTLLREGRSIRYFVPPTVATFITERELYAWSASSTPEGRDV
ncbi:MAG: nicotinate-nucleotide adenylyltransferase, partial [Candidatus Binatia bacterium]